MITKRSNHIPTLTTNDNANIAGMLVRIFFDQKKFGDTTLHVNIVQ